MKVWIDQDACTGDALCVEFCRDMFEVQDGVAYVKEAEWKNLIGPDAAGPEPTYRMEAGKADVPADLVDDTVEAADQCPGECIFLDV